MMSALQVLAIGFGIAGYYALVAVGFALIFATLRIFHIAHGTVFLTAGYAFFFLHRVNDLDLVTSGILSVIVAALTGLGIDKAVYLPVMRRGGGMFSVFIASLGVALVFEAVFLVFTKGIVTVARTSALDIVTTGPIAFRILDFVIVGIVIVVYGLLFLWLHRTQTGLEVRGLTDNGPLAAVVGMNVAQTRNVIFLVASALAGIAGVLTAYDSGLTPDTGIRTLFIAVVAVILGGVQNILLGSIVGSISLGILTAYAGFLFPEWVTFSVFAMMIILILIRPRGLFG
ncbi:MAG: branched-chain amino acid ABC transporter permease [Hyphomicrobiales bacterium]|nr:branched-chain amino acid ABC transporter permease [Hyphomicrobiales bacterium]